MIKILFKTLVFLLFCPPAFSQKHSVSITSGRKVVGSFTNAVEEAYPLIDLICDPSDCPTITYSQKSSRFDVSSASLTYGYKWSSRWKMIIGYHQNQKGFGRKTTYTYSNAVQQDADNVLFQYHGIVLGVENTFYRKSRVSFNGSFLLNPEIHRVEHYFRANDKKIVYGNVGAIFGLNMDVKLWRFISLRLNPFGEIGITPYKKGLDIIDEISEYKPFGYGYQGGLKFDF